MTLRRQAQPSRRAETAPHHHPLPDSGTFLTVRRDGQVLFGRIRLARDFFARLRGLLLTGPMQADDGLLLSPCSQVHTIGMTYPIDLIFLDRSGRVLRCLSDVRPYRAVRAPGAFYTLEVAAGRVKRLGVMPGQMLNWTPAQTSGGSR
ncbi:MAG: DUF192 domain-containing protein [Burkholderiaceae bacterium]